MKLPKVYANPLNKKINNYQDMYRSTKNNKYNIKDINKKIDEIFGSLNHVYKSKVKITINNQELDEVIVGKTNTSILTIDGKKIDIKDIENIEKVY